MIFPHAILRLCAAATVALAALAVAPPAAAQSAEQDPPGRVARLLGSSGRVWLNSEDSNEWIEVRRNQPLTGGDRLATAAGARADIALGSTTLRLDADTELELAQLDDARLTVELRRGSVAVRLRSREAVAEFSLVTDSGSFRAETVGRYRFDRLDDTSEATVLTGQAVFEGRASALHLGTGQHAQFWLDAAGTPQYSLVAPARDVFAGFIDERDRADDRVAPVRHVSAEMTGAEDLERYGQWEQSAEYGPIWYPRVVPSGWAPYSSGRWAWVRPWGWTWVDDAPWGFAPFHYGRWVNQRNAWYWAPGRYVARPVYAPALVAWTGGARGGVSVGIGAAGAPVGWFALAPREVYVPGYRSSSRHARDLNFAQIGNAASIDAAIEDHRGGRDRRDFANRRFANAVTVMPSGAFAGRQPVGASAGQYRQDAQGRALIAAARNGPVLAAPPVAAPPPPVRRAEDRPPRRPEAEAPPRGAGDGRQDNARVDRRPDRFDRADRRDGVVQPGIVRPEAPRPGAFPQQAQRPVAPPPAAGMAAPPIGLAAPPISIVAPPISIVAPPIGIAAPPIRIAAPPIGIAAPPLAPVPRLEQPVGNARRHDGATMPSGLPVQRPQTPDRSRALEERRDGLREPRERSR